MRIRHLIILVYFLLLLLKEDILLAHRINIFAYVEDDTVYTESYFSDGKKVKNGLIEVYDSQGNRLLKGRTDREGQFNFKLPKKDDLKITITTDMGHKNFYLLSKEELPARLNRKEAEELKDLIEACLDEKLRPIIRELKRMQDKTSFMDLISGVGYILGITGIVFYFLAKKYRV